MWIPETLSAAKCEPSDSNIIPEVFRVTGFCKM